jgi:hypothetical protein
MTAFLALTLLLAPDFTNIAEDAGIPDIPSGRAVFVDLDGDGKLDIVLNRRDVLLQKNGRFVAGPALPYQPTTVLFADFDNDGDQDAFAGMVCEPDNPKWKDHGRKNALFVQEKDGWEVIDLKMPRTAVHAVCAVDYDQDGHLDLYIGSGYRVYGASLECQPNRMYLGPTYIDATERLGLLTQKTPGTRRSSKPTYGVTHGDFNGDGKQDLWVCTYGRQWNFLWVNGNDTANDVAEQTGFDGDKDRTGAYSPAVKKFFKEKYGAERENEKPFRSNGNTFDCAIADYDNDGDTDCILAEITHMWAGPSSDQTSLLVQEDGRFSRIPFTRTRADEKRWNQGDIHCGWIDFDNDGLLDALIASSDYPDKQELKLYRQKKDHTFEKPRSLDWEGAAQISVGDFDNDGDLDILCGRSLNRLPKERRAALGKRAALFRNDVGNKNGWLQVECVGKAANRDGIGARIRVTTADGVTQTREIRGGHGHAGHNNPYIAHFGLAKHTEVKKLEIRWPDKANTVQVMESVKAGQRLVVRQKR